MSRTSWVELCVSDFEQSVTWFEHVLGFRVVAREGTDYVELSRGETSIQLASDAALYWAPERARLLLPGQRGSGVEVVLLVDNIDAVYRQAQQAKADIVRPLADESWHMRQFWVRHPDGYLIRPAQRILSVNPAAYRRQVDEAFRRETPRIADGLLGVKREADRLAQQGDILGAATIYETLVLEIFEQSHLYFDEEAEYDGYYEEEGYYPEEEGLEELIGACIDALGHGLIDPKTDRVAREKSIEVLFAIYRRDVRADGSHGFARGAADQLVSYATALERGTIAVWVRAVLAEEEEAIAGFERQAYGRFLLGLERDALDDEAYLRICRETGLTSDLVDRLILLGRIEEAARETRHVDDLAFLGLADLFVRHGQEAEAERLAKVRVQEKPVQQVLEWLQKYYQTRGNLGAELEVAAALFRTQPFVRRYQELRDLARRLDHWEKLREELLAFLEQARNTTLIIQIALEEGDIDKAIQLLKGMAQQDSYGYTYNKGYGYYGFGDIALEVARAAETERPHEAIELYRQSAERWIALRGRENYVEACKYLAKMRALYERLGEQEEWTRYITLLREQNRNLRALKEELATSGL